MRSLLSAKKYMYADCFFFGAFGSFFLFVPLFLPGAAFFAGAFFLAGARLPFLGASEDSLSLSSETLEISSDSEEERLSSSELSCFFLGMTDGRVDDEIIIP